MNMNERSCRSQDAVRDPEWYTRSSSRLKPDSPCTETTVVDEMTSMNGSLTSLNLDSMNIDFENLGGYSTRSMPAILASDAPWNESPRSLRVHTPASARRVATLSVPPPGVSPLDHLQNSISSINFVGRGPPLGHVITEEDYTDMTDFNESLASLEIENLRPAVSAVDMDATAHAGNVSRNGPASTRRVFSSTQNTGYGNNAAPYRPNQTVTDDEDNDDTQIINLLRDQVQTLKEQLAKEQSKNLRDSAKHNSFHSHQSSATNSSFAKDDVDDDETSLDSPNGDSSCETAPVSNGINQKKDSYRETMDAIQSAFLLLETSDEYNMIKILTELRRHVKVIEYAHDNTNAEQVRLASENETLLAKNKEQAKLIEELQNQLKK